MKNRTPTKPIVPDFTPVPRKYRHDGWTPERQRAFIDALADTGSVKWAATRINMSPEGAYYLRRQPGAESFRAAWNAALDHGVQKLVDLAIDRVTEGVPVPVYWRGEQVGEKRAYNERLLMFLLKHHLPDRYGATALRGGTKSPETLAHEAEEDAAWLAEVAGWFCKLLGAQRRLMRRAVIALLTGDQPAAADFENRARQIEEALLRPDLWAVSIGVEQIADFMDERDREHGAELLASGETRDANRWCRPLAEAPNDGIPDPDAPALEKLPRDSDGIPLPRLPLPQAMRHRVHIGCGPTYNERYRARRAAEAQIAAAQAEWLAAGCEEDWAKAR